VTLLMFDLDHFKSINDKFGHLVGDEVLRVFAQVVRRSMRTTDIIGRIGGEEFAAIVAEPMELALLIAERVRAGFEIAGALVAGQPVGATVSIGAATAHELVTNIDALIARADAALYRAKGEGRNRLRSADAEPAQQHARLMTTARGQAGKVRRLLQRQSAA
jgi:diguanylate cyclase (GGDEF)-like protein